MSNPKNVTTLPPEKLKCLALACSPRKDGNTSLLAAAALEECRKAGCETEFIRLRDYNYEPCRACGGCNTTGRCVINDDAAKLYQKILTADRLIIAAPIFSMGLNAQAKAFIDRAQQFWAAKYLLGHNTVDPANRPERKGIYISCAGTTLPDVFSGALRVIKYFFMILEIKLEQTLCYKGIDQIGEVQKHQNIFEEIREAGNKLAKI